MITHRIATALRRQEWVTIVIEFVLVIAGVLIALQVDQWNDARKERAVELTLLAAAREDVERDELSLENADLALATVSELGAVAIAALKADDCVDNCWTTLVAFFHASQWIDVQLLRSTYEEMKRMGLPRDAELRSAFSTYYDLNDQSAILFAEFPRYREVVRSTIPAATQEYLWRECFRVDGRHQFLIADCPPPENGGGARETIGLLRSNPDVEMTLNFWISTVTVVRSTLEIQISAAKSIIADISIYLEQQG